MAFVALFDEIVGRFRCEISAEFGIINFVIERLQSDFELTRNLVEVNGIVHDALFHALSSTASLVSDSYILASILFVWETVNTIWTAISTLILDEVISNDFYFLFVI